MEGVADLGGSIITGIDGNPLAVLAAQLRIPLHHINSKDVPLFRDDGAQADRTLDSKVRATSLAYRRLCRRSSLSPALQWSVSTRILMGKELHVRSSLDSLITVTGKMKGSCSDHLYSFTRSQVWSACRPVC